MKKLSIVLIAAMIAVATVSCQRHGHLTIISTNTNGQYKKVEYTGFIVFNTDKTGIETMSPGSYLKYKTNNDELTAKCDPKGIITYEFFGDKSTKLNNEGKQVLTQAIKMVSEQQEKPKPNHG